MIYDLVSKGHDKVIIMMTAIFGVNQNEILFALEYLKVKEEELKQVWSNTKNC